MRPLLLAAVLLTSSSALAQDASELATLIAHPDAQLLSAEEAATLGLKTEGPVWLVPVEAPEATPSLGYEVPASALSSEKDPTLALVLGIVVPGGGQIYAEEYEMGLTLLAIGYGSAFGGWFLSHALDIPLLSLVGAAGYLGATIYGALHAQEDAEAANRRNGFALAPRVTRTDGGTAGGLSLRASF
ncbi:MAG: hypothetical protein Rubg2KO_11190 [Rubricoccaceae bacterium]